ncbi:hypothetical protein [Nocardia sp. XZ_19_231]|uniref:hypothetical protein n=1 Tax=Nocardia sp. XZ_19_231 TaxID=2769252 RepID=UPI001E311D86|nr:hypothetical protein [Nocardia sp. XZ_19_231]
MDGLGPAVLASVRLEAAESYAITSRVAATVAARLADGDGSPGALTPGALFGPDLARSAGGTITVNSNAKDQR